MVVMSRDSLEDRLPPWCRPSGQGKGSHNVPYNKHDLRDPTLRQWRASFPVRIRASFNPRFVVDSRAGAASDSYMATKLYSGYTSNLHTSHLTAPRRQSWPPPCMWPAVSRTFLFPS